MHARRRIEQSFVVEAIRDHLDDFGLHPCLPYIVNARWPHATIDDAELPRDWIEQAARACMSVLRQHPWTPGAFDDAGVISMKALEPIARLLCDVRQWAGVER